MYYYVQSMTYQSYEYVILFNAIQVISYFFLVFLLSRSQSWCQYPPPNSYRLLFSWDGWFTESMFVAKNMLHLKSWKSIPLCHDPVFLNTHGPWPQINEMSLHLRSRLHIFWDPHFEYIPFQFCFKSHLSLLNLGEIHLCCRLFVLTSLFLFSSEQLGFNICPSTPQVHVWVCLKMGNTPQIEILFSGEHAD